MKLKLTDLQTHKLRTSYQNASEVLNEIKRKPLKGDALKDMKNREASVQHLGAFLLGK